MTAEEMKKREEIIMGKGKPVLQNRYMNPAVRTFRLVLCVMVIAAIFRGLILHPIGAMNDLEMQFTGLEWSMVITGFVCIQILMLSMYREIKYGGFKEGRWIN